MIRLTGLLIYKCWFIITTMNKQNPLALVLSGILSNLSVKLNISPAENYSI